MYYILTYYTAYKNLLNSQYMTKQPTKTQLCTLHQQLIQQLLNENVLVKEKYEALLKEYEKLRYKYDRLCKQSSPTLIQQIQGATGIKEIDDLNVLQTSQEIKARSSRLGQKWDNHALEDKFQNQTPKPGSMGDIGVDNRNLLGVTKNETLPPQMAQNRRRTSSRTSRTSSVSEKFFSLIEGCFIIQKKKCYAQKSKNTIQQMIEYIYPQQIMKTQKQTLEMMLKYAFNQPQIIKIQDDQENSRKNQVLFGTPYQDYCFAFQDGKWVSKRELPEIMKLMGTMKKKYYHILVKPQIVENKEMEIKIENENEDIKQQSKQETEVTEKQQKPQYFYQTQVIFGFISSFPLRLFFQDLHRTIQQQLKYSQFEIDQKKQQVFNPTTNRRRKYEVLGKIMQKLYDQQYKINKFPLHCAYNTGITKIQLNIPTVIDYREMEDDFLNQVLNKYDNISICKLLHYVLTQKCILIGATDKRSLNQLFEAIRIMIRPFMWMFAVVYVYSDYFQPFMSSPMPIIIGKIESQQQQTKQDQKENKKERQSRNSVQYSDFCLIKMNGQENQLSQKDQFYKTIKKFKKQWDKYQKDKKSDKATLIHKYVHNLRVFIEKGILNSEPTDFHIEFIDTQMVSYFKDTRDEF